MSEIVSEVISIWNFATIPTISNANAYKMLERLVDKYQQLQRTTNKQRSLSSQYILFVNDLNVLSIFIRVVVSNQNFVKL